MNSIIDYLAKWAKLTPQNIYICEDEMSWSFKSFYEDVGKLSAFFKEKGIKKGDYVVLHLDKKSQHLLSYMALLNIGAISIHIYPERESEYVKFAADYCSAKVIISDKFSDSIKDVLVLNDINYKNYQPLCHTDVNEIAYIMFTSGTTSTPKAVQITQKNVLSITNTLIELADMKENHEKEIIFMPLGSTGGLGHFHATLMLGNYVRLFPGLYSQLKSKDINLLLDTIEKEEITGVLFTPNIVTRLLLNNKQRFKVVAQNLHYILANVTPMRKEIIMELLELLPNLRFCTYYGSTEASRSIVNVCRDSLDFEHFTGKPPHNIQIKIAEPNQEGEGEVYIKGDNVTKGYLYQKDDGFDNGWFKSGDIGKVYDNGFIQILGRVKDIINIDGLKIFPTELENIILSHPDIIDIGVCALLDEITYNQIGLAIVTDEKIDKATLIEEIYQLLKSRYKIDETDLYTYKIPQKIYFEKKIPKTDLGKVKRDALLTLLSSNQHPFYLNTKDMKKEN